MDSKTEKQPAAAREILAETLAGMGITASSDDTSSSRAPLGKTSQQQGAEPEKSYSQWRAELIDAQQERCRQCDGTECSSESKGYIPAYQYGTGGEGGPFYESVSPCQYTLRQQNQEKQQHLFRFSKIPVEFAGQGFDSYEVTPENEKAVKVGRWIVDHDEKGAMFYGGVGSGKTKLAAIVANAKIRAGKEVLFANASDLLADIRSSFKTGNTDEILHEARNVRCLVLDDLGAEQSTGWSTDQITALINHRLGERLQTIITTNYTPEGLVRRMATTNRRGEIIDDLPGRRVISRLCLGCYIIRLDGPDYRMRGH